MQYRHIRDRTLCVVVFTFILVMLPQSVLGQTCPAEPNDTSAQASVIASLPFDGPCTIDVEGDVDWFRIQLTAGTSYAFDVTSLTDLDTALELYGPGDADGDPVGTLVAENDDEVDFQPRILHTALSSGFYFLKLKISEFADPLDQTGSYTLDVADFVPDNDNTPPFANLITPPFMNTYEIDPVGDVDWYRIDMVTGGTYEFDVSSTLDYDSALWLYGPGTLDGSSTGSLVADNDDTGEFFQPFISYTAAADGWYYLRVSYFDNAPYSGSAMAKAAVSSKTQSAVGPYSLSVTADPPLAVELESLDAIVTEGRSVVVRWETISETANLGFEVQTRQRDASESQWRASVFVPSTSRKGRAQYSQTIPSVAAGVHDVRLKIIGTDGTFEYSPQISVAVIGDGLYQLGALYPNPADAAVTVPLSVSNSQEVALEVFDLLGRRRQITNVSLEANATASVRLDVAALTAGTYLVRVQGQSFVATGVFAVGR